MALSSHDQALGLADEILGYLHAENLDQAEWARVVLLCLALSYNVQQARQQKEQHGRFRKETRG